MRVLLRTQGRLVNAIMSEDKQFTEANGQIGSLSTKAEVDLVYSQQQGFGKDKVLWINPIATLSAGEKLVYICVVKYAQQNNGVAALRMAPPKHFKGEGERIKSRRMIPRLRKSEA